MKPQTLPKQLKSLCNRVAFERSRSVAWEQGLALRTEALRRLTECDVAEVERWLGQLMREAITEQV